MKKMKKYLSPAGRDKLADRMKKQNTVPLYVVGIHVNETDLSFSMPKQASGRKSAGLSSFAPCNKKAEWNGITDFVVPPNCFEFLCTKDKTYQDVFSAFLKEAVLEQIKKPAEGAVILAFSFPVHSLWNDSAVQLRALLDRCFADCDWILPAVVSIFDDDANADASFFVYLDKKWTTFRWGNGKKVSAAYGTDTDFRDFRCNEYWNNSTGAWSSKSFPSWEAGFMDICCTLSNGGNDVSKKAVIFTDKKCSKAVPDLIVKSKLASDTVFGVAPAGIAAQIVLNCFEKMDPTNQCPTPPAAGGAGKIKKTSKELTERPVKTAEDLFKW